MEKTPPPVSFKHFQPLATLWNTADHKGMFVQLVLYNFISKLVLSLYRRKTSVSTSYIMVATLWSLLSHCATCCDGDITSLLCACVYVCTCFQLGSKFNRKPLHGYFSNFLHLFGIVKRQTILIFKSISWKLYNIT